MTFYRKVTNSDILKKVIDLPKSLQNKEVEILVFPYEKDKDTDESERTKKKNSTKGLLENHKNLDLLNEENNAWPKAVEEEYEDY
jgi:F0F1-type ATP synthase epsilon subunit